MKVVINKCYGGFGLSIRAQKAINKIGCPHSKYILEDDYFTTPDIDKKVHGSVEVAREKHAKFCEMHRKKGEGKILEDDHSWGKNGARACPVLIEVVERLKKEANGQHAELKIVEIPDDVEWEIEEYDGIEWIAESHQTWG